MVLYAIIHIIGVCVRQFILPNPFEPLGSAAAIVNLIVGLVMGPITYAMVGCIYHSGSAPALGSLLYLLFYAINTGAMYFVCLACPTIWLMIFIAIAYFVVMFVALNKLRDLVF